MIRHRNLTKGGYANGGANSYEYSYINSSTYGSQSYKETSSSSNNNSGNKRQEAIQIWPQEVNLKLRISKLLHSK